MSDAQYSRDKPGWHDYLAGPKVVCTAAQRCSREEIADQLSRFAVPGQDPSKPAENGRRHPVYYPITGLKAGMVDTEISADGLTVINRTRPGHIFHAGKIVRSAQKAEDGSWRVTTHGTGNNEIVGMSIANQYGGPAIFDILDSRMRSNIRAHHGTKQIDRWLEHHSAHAPLNNLGGLMPNFRDSGAGDIHVA